MVPRKAPFAITRREFLYLSSAAMLAAADRLTKAGEQRVDLLIRAVVQKAETSAGLVKELWYLNLKMQYSVVKLVLSRSRLNLTSDII